MKVLITGGSGFLGSYIVNYFSSNGIEVIALIRNKTNLYRYNNVFNSNITFINVEKTSLDQIFVEHEFNAVIHLATEYGRSGKISDVLTSNLIFPLNLLELAIKHKVKTFINTDSYFNKSEQFFYSSLPNYSLSKKSFISWLEKSSDKIQIINIYLEHMYGPFDSIEKFVENLIQTVAVKNQDTIKLTHGHQKRDFIFVSDVASAYLKIFSHSQHSHYKIQNYQVGTGQSTEIREFTRLALTLSNSTTKPLFGEIPYRDYEIMDSKADISLLVELNWKPKICLEQGIKQILNAYTKIKN